MNTSDAVTFFVTGVIYIAILYVLVKPGSLGAATVQTVGNALTALVKDVSGYTTPKAAS